MKACVKPSDILRRLKQSLGIIHLKRQVYSWHRQFLEGPNLVTVFFDLKGVLLIDFLYKRQTVNSTYYSQLLNNDKNSKLSEKMGLSHTGALTMEKIETSSWTTLEHTPYIPDLSPGDYHLFESIKEALRGQHFVDVIVEDLVYGVTIFVLQKRDSNITHSLEKMCH